MPENMTLPAVLPMPEAADLALQAARLGVPLGEYVGVQALQGAYGALHPVVLEAGKAWASLGRRGTCGDTQEGG